jgi:hypothetical protein
MLFASKSVLVGVAGVSTAGAVGALFSGVVSSGLSSLRGLPLLFGLFSSLETGILVFLVIEICLGKQNE